MPWALRPSRVCGAVGGEASPRAAVRPRVRRRRGKDEEGKFHVGSLTDRRQEEADDLQAHVNTTSA
jgi:hypothetical protein